MNERKRKLEPPLALDMDFDEALRRFAQAKPEEVEESIRRSKQQKPPGAIAPGGLEKSKREPSKGRKRKPQSGA